MKKEILKGKKKVATVIFVKSDGWRSSDPRPDSLSEWVVSRGTCCSASDVKFTRDIKKLFIQKKYYKKYKKYAE